MHVNLPSDRSSFAIVSMYYHNLPIIFLSVEKG